MACDGAGTSVFVLSLSYFFVADIMWPRNKSDGGGWEVSGSAETVQTGLREINLTEREKAKQDKEKKQEETRQKKAEIAMQKAKIKAEKPWARHSGGEEYFPMYIYTRL